uniref:Zinc knuckle CX2CX4HX4C domain-containing protein n=1 Tax=Chenopodium quinoa TaxID=63459 RepID=A0A803MTL1_CHEQI
MLSPLVRIWLVVVRISRSALPATAVSGSVYSGLYPRIGTLVKLDTYTLKNDDKAQFARVCLNIDISKPVPCTLSMKTKEKDILFHLSYEGVHEVCPLCGNKDHTLKSCPNKPAPCLDLIVAQLEASNLDQGGDQPSLPESDWIHVKPQHRARPRFFNRGGRVSSGDKIILNPPAPEGPNTTLEEDDLDETFFNALGIIHHNPDVNFDADMSFSSPSLETKSDNSKRRKRDDGDACSLNSVINYD